MGGWNRDISSRLPRPQPEKVCDSDFLCDVRLVFQASQLLRVLGGSSRDITGREREREREM
jgi:hypothetical protein